MMSTASAMSTVVVVQGRATFAGTILYKVKFMFAPGGPQQFEMEKGALNDALLL